MTLGRLYSVAIVYICNNNYFVGKSKVYIAILLFYLQFFGILTITIKECVVIVNVGLYYN